MNKAIIVSILLFFVCFACTVKEIQEGRHLDENVKLEVYYPPTPSGNISFSAAYLFSLTRNDSEIIGIVRCPDFYGDNFFVEGNKYTIQISNTNIEDSLKGRILNNPFKKERFPVFLISSIRKLQ